MSEVKRKEGERDGERQEQWEMESDGMRGRRGKDGKMKE